MADLITGILPFGENADQLPQIITTDFTSVTAIPAATDLQKIEVIPLKPYENNGVIMVDNAWVEVQAQDASGQLQVLTAHVILTGTSFFGGSVGGHYIRGTQLQVPPQNVMPKLAAAAGGVLPYVFEFQPVREDLIGVPGDQIEVHVAVVLRNLDAANPHSFQQFASVTWRGARRRFAR